MAQYRRILWGRVCAAVILLIALIFLLGACVSSLLDGGNRNDDSSQSGVLIPPNTNSQTDSASSGMDPSGTDSKSDPVTPGAYTEITMSPAAIYSGTLVLVNDSYPSHLSKDDLQLAQVAYFSGKPDCYSVSYPAYTLLNETALTHFNAMMEMYYSTKGNKEVMFNDGYLDAGSDKSTPESTCGLSIQLHLQKASGGFTYISNTEPYSWIYNNMANYGYILRYPAEKEAETGKKGTDSVIRYVGTPHANYITENNLCLEEYLQKLKNEYSYGKAMLQYETNGKRYSIYYVPASLTNDTTVPVPINGTYEISGNNTDGFIVTVTNS